jgi:putative cell wall-binding protein
MGIVAALSAGIAAVGVPTVANAVTAHSAVTTGVTRIAGATRTATAVAASQDEFTTAGSAKAVVIARDDTYPDALAGGPLAAKKGGPLLLTAPTSLDPAVQAELIRVLPKGGTVYILGGTSAISTGVETAITSLGFTVSRISGTDRFGTAVAIADAMGDPTTVFEATGLNYPDALAGVSAAIKTGGAILLTNGTTQSPETAAYLAAHTGGTHYALGGPAAAADGSATPLVGSDRYGTAAGVAGTFFPTATVVGIATGTNFPDALAAGPDLASKGAPLLLVAPTGPLPSGPTAALLSLASTVTGALVFGGTASVDDSVAAQVGTLTGLGAATTAASASAAFTGRYGILTQTLSGSTTGPATEVVDGTTGAVTIYTKTGNPTTAPGPTAAALAALPLTASSLVSAVNSLYATFDTSIGLTTTNADALFQVNSEQVFLNPTASPTLRLAVIGALAAASNTTVASEVADSTGRVGVEITATFPGTTSGTVVVNYIFDPTTGLPLQVAQVTPTGTVVIQQVINSITTTNTLPTNPYTS